MSSLSGGPLRGTGQSKRPAHRLVYPGSLHLAHFVGEARRVGQSPLAGVPRQDELGVLNITGFGDVLRCRTDGGLAVQGDVNDRA